MDRIYALINNFYAHFMGETGPTKIHELERKRLTLLLEYYKQKYNRTKYGHVNLLESLIHLCTIGLSDDFSTSSMKNCWHKLN